MTIYKAKTQYWKGRQASNPHESFLNLTPAQYTSTSGGIQIPLAHVKQWGFEPIDGLGLTDEALLDRLEEGLAPAGFEGETWIQGRVQSGITYWEFSKGRWQRAQT